MKPQPPRTSPSSPSRPSIKPAASTSLELLDAALDLHRTQRFAEAQSLYDKILARAQASSTGKRDAQAIAQQQAIRAVALHMSGTLSQQRGDFALAARQYANALALQPKPDVAAAIHGNIAMLHHATGKPEQAIASFHASFALDTSNGPIYNNFGTVLQAQGKLPAAMEAYLEALARQPDNAHAYCNLGSVAHDLGNLDEAIECYRQALAIDPDFAMAHNNYGNALRDRGDPAQARAHFERAIALDPTYAMAYNNLGNILRDQGHPEQAVASFRQALERDPSLSDVFSNMLLTIQSLEGMTPQALFEAHLEYAARYERPLIGTRQLHLNAREPHRRLKIGFVSGDFRDHPVSYFFEPVLNGIDRTSFEVFCYFNHHVADRVSDRIASRADHWLPCKLLSDQALADRIRADGIDILFDLSGHTAHNRLPVFARKPAPVQATWIGFPSTTGLQAIDYRLTDATLDPPGLTERFHTETLLRMDAYTAFTPSPACPPVNRLPALSGKPFTFACLNQLTKITDRAIAVWSRILKAMPQARLMLANVNDAVTGAHVHARFAACGIDAERIVLQPRMALEAYLALHHQIDLALDSFPQNGGTITCHSLSMGVPAIGLTGVLPVARAGMAILSGVGLASFVADSEDRYVQRALDVAADLPALDALRQVLRQRLIENGHAGESTPAENFQTMMRSVWMAWCNAQHPQEPAPAGAPH